MLNPRYFRWLLGLAVLPLVADAGAQQPGRPPELALLSAQSLVEEVAQAMGGRERILAVRTLVLEGTGEQYNLGQGVSPEAALPVYAVTELRRSIDFANRRWRHEQSREPRFLTGNTAAQRARLGYDSVAFNILADGTVQRAAARADAERANELLYHPIGFLQVALAPGTELTEERSRGELRHVRMNVGGNKFEIFIDRRTRLPVRIEKIEYHPVLGDAVFGTTFADWRTVDGLQLPMRTTWRIDERWPLSDLRFSKVSVNADVGDLTAPAAARSAQPPSPVINVTADEIAPGVWYLAGQSHHSVAIEMRDHLLLVEAPQSDARTLAVIQKARTLRSGKAVRAVINTHHHFDHSGGVRAAIAEGLTVITHSGNKALFEELARRRHFIVADALANSRRPARIQGVGPRTVLSDGRRNVEIHQIRGNPHSGTMLMVYLPAEKLLIEADVYSPPALNATTVPPAPFAANLVENIDRLGLQVDRIVPIHGRVIPMSDLRAAAANPAANPAQVIQQQTSVTLPPELARVLRDYERAWQARDAAGLAALFTEDGMTLSNALPLRRGRPAIQAGYATSGGPLSLRAVSYATDDTVGYIIGGYSEQPGQPDIGKFVLALRRAPGGPWRIAADIDNSNQPPRRPPGN